MSVPGQKSLTERQQCPCCSHVEFQLLVREGYNSSALRAFLDRHYAGRANLDALAADHYELVRCLKCGFAFQRTIPTDELVDEIYEEWIPPSEKDRLQQERTLDDYRYMAEQVEFIVQHLKRRPYDIRVLDFGMGWAEWASMARAFGCQVAGTELSQHRIRHAHSMGIEVVPWDDIPNRKFDFINAEQVFEHLIDPLSVLQHLAKALAEDGVLRIAVPNSASAIRRAARKRQFGELRAKDVMPLQPLEHVNSYTFESLVKVAERAELTAIRPSLRQLYNSSSGWMSVKNAFRLAVRPVYRHVFPKSTIVYFTRA